VGGKNVNKGGKKTDPKISLTGGKTARAREVFFRGGHYSGNATVQKETWAENGAAVGISKEIWEGQKVGKGVLSIPSVRRQGVGGKKKPSGRGTLFSQHTKVDGDP